MWSRKQLLTILPIIMLLACLHTNVYAYRLIGWKWEDHSATYNSANLPQAWRLEIYNARQIWNAAPGNFVFSFCSSSDNIIDQSNFGNQAPIAVAFLYPDGNEHFARVNVYFNTAFDFYNDGRDYDIQTVMLHEFGHFLGLDDIPWYEFWLSGSIMWYAYKGVQHYLAQDDSNGLQAIYGP